MLDSIDAMHIVKMDLANLIMKAPPEKREVSNIKQQVHNMTYVCANRKHLFLFFR